MSILGTVGYLYMAILVILLIIGFGLIGLKFVNYILTIDRIKTNTKNEEQIIHSNKVETQKWLKIALYSFLGIMVTVLVLAVISSGGTNNSHM